MTEQPVVTLLIQDRQHLRKLQGLLPFFPQDVTVHLLLDDMMSRAQRQLSGMCERPVLLLSSFSGNPCLPVSENPNLLDRLHELANKIFNGQNQKKNNFVGNPLRGLSMLWDFLRIKTRKTFPRLYVFFAEAKTLFRTRRWRAGEHAIKKYIARYRPSLLILAEGNVQYMSEVFIKPFRAAGAGAIIAPYTFCTPEEPANYYKDHFLFWAHPYHHWFLRQKWFYTYQGQEMIRLPFFLAMLYEKLGYAPPQPWVLESSSVDAILVESEAMKRHYIKQNIPESQICLVGDGAYDRIHTVLDARADYRTKFRAEHGLPDSADKWLLFAVFPDLSSTFGPDDDFATYHDALAAIIDALASMSGWTIILSIHPSLDPKPFAKYTGERIILSKWPAMDAIGLCDLYVASISATIRWAIAAEWGMVDGKFAERFQTLIHSYLSRSDTTKKVTIP